MAKRAAPKRSQAAAVAVTWLATGPRPRVTTHASPGHLFEAKAAPWSTGVASLSCCDFAAARVPGGGQSVRRSPPRESFGRVPRISFA
jgi:hypothetical protein